MSRIDVLAAAHLPEAVGQGVVLRVLVKAGDRVARHGVIAELETDKANIEVDAPESGTVEEVMVSKGDVVDRQSVLARLVTTGEPAVVTTKPKPTKPKVAPPPAVAPAERRDANEPRCAFCRALRVRGRIDCVKCGAPY